MLAPAPVRIDREEPTDRGPGVAGIRSLGGWIMARCVLRMGSLVIAFLLASCSGGGGDGGGGGPSMSVSPRSFTFTATQGGATPAPQEAGITISGGSVAVGIDSNSASSFVNATFTITGPTTGKITLTPLSPSFVAPGTHTGVVVVRGCLDPFCSTGDAAGSPVSINISYTVQPQTGLRASPQSLSFTQLKGGAAPVAQTLGLSDAQGASYAWTASIVYQSSTTGWLNINGAQTASAASLPSNLSVSINPTTTVGTLNALIRFTGNGNTLDVPVTYTVSEPTLTRSPAQMTFSAAASGALPSTQTVTLSTQNSLPVDYTTSVTYGAGATGWLDAPVPGTAPGNASVGVNTTGLAQGTYTATLKFTTPASQVVSIDVTYVVTSATITFTPGSASFAIGPSSTATALSQTLAVGSTGVAFSWTATSNQPWVSVSPASGNTGSNVTLSLVPAQLDTLDPGVRSATITFNYTAPGGGATSTPLTVSLTLNLPKISWVSPYVAQSATSREVILRGKGFNNAGGAALDFGGTSVPSSSYTVVSDTEIRVTHPAFTAGPARRITFPNSLANPSIVRSAADLVVVDATAYAATSLGYPDSSRTVQRIAYDAERRAVLVAVRFPAAGDIGAVYRYAFDGSLWNLSSQAPAVGGLQDFALGPDGKKLFVTSGGNLVTPYDPVTLAAGTSASVSLFSFNFVKQIVMANDGNAVVTTGINGSGFVDTYRYSVADATFTKFLGGCCFLPQAGASANGSRIVVANTGLSPAMSAYQYDASSGTLGATSLVTSEANPAPALDRSATRILLGGHSVYDSSYQLLGTVPFHNTAVLSPDGTKAYMFGNGVDTKVHVYNLAASPVSGVFPQIGTGTATPSNPGAGTRMTISPDGGTLFIAGDTGIVVMPAP
jgi:BACON domain-containing protein